MKNLNDYLESGMLDLYVAGALSEAENIALTHAASQDPTLMAEILALQESYEMLALANTKTPPAKSKIRFMDAMDQMEAESGKVDPLRPPVLNASSKPEDYDFWVKLDISVRPAEFENLFFVPVAENEDGFTAVVWINGQVEEETHLDSIEKFLVLEGACTIDIEGEVHHLTVGDCLSIPKFKAHVVNVTSDIPCKLIVQRIAA